MANSIEPGEVRVGQLHDGEEDELTQSAALLYEEGAAALLKVPHVIGELQFKRTTEWFRGSAPPETLIFSDDRGHVTLTGLRLAGWSGGSRVTGRLRAGTAILSLPRKLRDSYSVREMTSSIDGLLEFASFEPVKTNLDSVSSVSELEVSVDASEEVSWRSAGFTYTVRSNATWSATDGQQFTVANAPILSTSCSRRATPDEHLTAQWAIRALLLMIHGEKVAWRRHLVFDNEFPTWMLSGDARPPRFVEARLSRTAKEATAAPANHQNFALPWLRLSDLDSRGMRRWTELYSNEEFRRGIEPIAEVINGASRFREPQLMMTAIALDCMDFYRDSDRTVRRTLEHRVLGCLNAADLDLSSIGEPRHIAKAIASMNNDLKHPDRLQRPESVALHCVTDLAILVARAQLLSFLNLSPGKRRDFMRTRRAYQTIDAFKRNGIRVDGAGKVVPR